MVDRPSRRPGSRHGLGHLPRSSQSRDGVHGHRDVVQRDHRTRLRSRTLGRTRRSSEPGGRHGDLPSDPGPRDERGLCGVRRRAGARGSRRRSGWLKTWVDEETELPEEWPPMGVMTSHPALLDATWEAANFLWWTRAVEERIERAPPPGSPGGRPRLGLLPRLNPDREARGQGVATLQNHRQRVLADTRALANYIAHVAEFPNAGSAAMTGWATGVAPSRPPSRIEPGSSPTHARRGAQPPRLRAGGLRRGGGAGRSGARHP